MGKYILVAFAVALMVGSSLQQTSPTLNAVVSPTPLCVSYSSDSTAVGNVSPTNACELNCLVGGVKRTYNKKDGEDCSTDTLANARLSGECYDNQTRIIFYYKLSLMKDGGNYAFENSQSKLCYRGKCVPQIASEVAADKGYPCGTSGTKGDFRAIQKGTLPCTLICVPIPSKDLRSFDSQATFGSSCASGRNIGSCSGTVCRT